MFNLSKINKFSTATMWEKSLYKKQLKEYLRIKKETFPLLGWLIEIVPEQKESNLILENTIYASNYSLFSTNGKEARKIEKNGLSLRPGFYNVDKVDDRIILTFNSDEKFNHNLLVSVFSTKPAMESFNIPKDKNSTEFSVFLFSFYNWVKNPINFDFIKDVSGCWEIGHENKNNHILFTSPEKQFIVMPIHCPN